MSSQARLGARTPMDVGSFYSLMGGNGKPKRRQILAAEIPRTDVSQT